MRCSTGAGDCVTLRAHGMQPCQQSHLGCRVQQLYDTRRARQVWRAAPRCHVVALRDLKVTPRAHYLASQLAHQRPATTWLPCRLGRVLQRGQAAHKHPGHVLHLLGAEAQRDLLRAAARQRAALMADAVHPCTHGHSTAPHARAYVHLRRARQCSATCMAAAWACCALQPTHRWCLGCPPCPGCATGS
jgi:hypothetical protein